MSEKLCTIASAFTHRPTGVAAAHRDIESWLAARLARKGGGEFDLGWWNAAVILRQMQIRQREVPQVARREADGHRGGSAPMTQRVIRCIR
ncbi:hypothetical protein [Nocardia sp. NPDC059691]|uniref:hypothetical protein n=1 Tax=Nocardia sp. NPDC059691 TaxID=3346908 RepID=UPI00369A9CAB